MSKYCHIQTLERLGRESFDKKRCNQIDERVREFEKLIRKFLVSNGLDDSSVRLNKPTLATSILDYFVDIQRLKDFHNSISRINEDKIIAYECAWILKRKPIQVLRDEIGSIHINEKFVAEVIMNHLVGDFRNDRTYPEISKCVEIKEFYKHLLYYLIYRPSDAQALELVIVAFKTALEVAKVYDNISCNSFANRECNQIGKRTEKFEEVCQKFLTSNGFDDSSARLNKSALKAAILEYSVDVQSLKSIYGVASEINEDKVVAYSCAGILKHKPVQLLCDDTRFVHINEKFVADVIMEHLVGNFRAGKNSFEINRSAELKEFYKHLLYHLIYRPTDASSLEFMIVAFKTSAVISKFGCKVPNKV